MDVSEAVVSGKGHIHSFTINYHSWNPSVELPYVIALVEMAEQAGLRLTTNIIGTPAESIEIGQAVQVNFEACEGDVYLPLFELI